MDNKHHNYNSLNRKSALLLIKLTEVYNSSNSLINNKQDLLLFYLLNKLAHSVQKIESESMIKFLTFALDNLDFDNEESQNDINSIMKDLDEEKSRKLQELIKELKRDTSYIKDNLPLMIGVYKKGGAYKKRTLRKSSMKKNKGTLKRKKDKKKD
jgi:hypothetical protein